MIYENDENVSIEIDEEELLKSIALLGNMRDFCKKQTGEGVSETVFALQTAIETMKAFWIEHFQQDGEVGQFNDDEN